MTEADVGHPDSHQLARVRSALEAWEQHGPRGITSAILGTGAVAAAQALISDAVEGRPATLVPSASLAMLTALRACAVTTGTAVLLPRYDWPASLTAVRLLGATPVFVDTDETSGTIDPAHAARLRTADTVTVIATHLHGVPADIPALRDSLPGLPIIEDCAQAWGSTLDKRPVGAFGDLAVFSFASVKTIDAGEVAAIVTTPALHDSVLRLAGHPSRQALAGIDVVSVEVLGIRPDPVAAIRLWWELSSWQPEGALARRAEVIEQHKEVHPDEVPLGRDARRSVVSNIVAFRGAGKSSFALDLAASSPRAMPNVCSVLAAPARPDRLRHTSD